MKLQNPRPMTREDFKKAHRAARKAYRVPRLLKAAGVSPTLMMHAAKPEFGDWVSYCSTIHEPVAFVATHKTSDTSARFMLAQYIETAELVRHDYLCPDCAPQSIIRNDPEAFQAAKDGLREMLKIAREHRLAAAPKRPRFN